MMFSRCAPTARLMMKASRLVVKRDFIGDTEHGRVKRGGY